MPSLVNLPPLVVNEDVTNAESRGGLGRRTIAPMGGIGVPRPSAEVQRVVQPDHDSDAARVRTRIRLTNTTDREVLTLLRAARQVGAGADPLFRGRQPQ